MKAVCSMFPALSAWPEWVLQEAHVALRSPAHHLEHVGETTWSAVLLLEILKGPGALGILSARVRRMLG